MTYNGWNRKGNISDTWVFFDLYTVSITLEYYSCSVLSAVTRSSPMASFQPGQASPIYTTPETTSYKGENQHFCQIH